MWCVLCSALLCSALLYQLFHQGCPRVLLSIRVHTSVHSGQCFHSNCVIFHNVLKRLHTPSHVALLSAFSARFSAFQIVLMFPHHFSTIVRKGSEGYVGGYVSIPGVSFCRGGHTKGTILDTFPKGVLRGATVGGRPPNPLIQKVPKNSYYCIMTTKTSLIGLILSILMNLVTLSDNLHRKLIVPPIRSTHTSNGTNNSRLLRLYIISKSSKLTHYTRGLIDRYRDRDYNTNSYTGKSIVIIRDIILSIRGRLS